MERIGNGRENRPEAVGLDGALVVEGPAQPVEHATQERVADRALQRPLGRHNRKARMDPFDRPQEHEQRSVLPKTDNFGPADRFSVAFDEANVAD